MLDSLATLIYRLLSQISPHRYLFHDLAGHVRQLRAAPAAHTAGHASYGHRLRMGMIVAMLLETLCSGDGDRAQSGAF